MRLSGFVIMQSLQTSKVRKKPLPASFECKRQQATTFIPYLTGIKAIINNNKKIYS